MFRWGPAATRCASACVQCGRAAVQRLQDARLPASHRPSATLCVEACVRGAGGAFEWEQRRGEASERG